MRMLHSLASAPAKLKILPISAHAERKLILPISALLRTLFTPSHDPCFDHFHFNPQLWIGPGRMRMLHSLVVSKPTEQMRLLALNMEQNNSDSLKIPMEQLRLLRTDMAENNYKTATIEKFFKDMETRRDCVYEETHSSPCVYEETHSSPCVYEETHSSPCCCSMEWSLNEVLYIQEESSEWDLFFPGEQLLINRGDHVDLQQLLFTQERDFLMKSNGEKVEMDGLSNKYVLLYIFPLVGSHKIPMITRELVELRNLLLDKGFEIVFVGLSSDRKSSKQRKCFKKYSSQMTWPFIPYEDHDAREHVKSTFGFSQTFFAKDSVDDPYCGIIDPYGEILQSWAWVILSYYGHDAFPFTNEKLWSMFKEEDSMFTEGVSLKALLGTSNRDYVLSPEGDKVPIQDLEDKVVCIILDDPAVDPHARLIEDIFANINLDAHPDFVPLYVCRNFPDSACFERYIHIEAKAKKECESVCWLRIPYGDSAIRKIWRVILRHCDRDVTFCSVVGPHGSYVDFHTLTFMDLYGSEAYPFTARRVAELKAQELQVNLMLEDVLQPTCQINRNGRLEVILHPDCRIPRYGGQKDDALVLYNKRLLVLFGTHSCCELGQFLCELRVLYNQKKGTNEEFEVIYISLDCLRSDFEESTSRMPWFVFPFRRKEVVNTLGFCEYLRYLDSKIPYIMAFERDGLLVGMEGYLHQKKVKPHFPYVNSVTDEIFKKEKYVFDYDHASAEYLNI